jgi:hypothetical protein
VSLPGLIGDRSGLAATSSFDKTYAAGAFGVVGGGGPLANMLGNISALGLKGPQADTILAARAAALQQQGAATDAYIRNATTLLNDRFAYTGSMAESFVKAGWVQIAEGSLSLAKLEHDVKMENAAKLLAMETERIKLDSEKVVRVEFSGALPEGIHAQVKPTPNQPNQQNVGHMNAPTR